MSRIRTVNKPSYMELERKVKELERLVNIKVFPQDIPNDLLLFRMGKDWCFDLFDEKISELTGYDLNDLRHNDICWLDIVHEVDRKLVQNALVTAMESNNYFDSEFRIVTKQGRIRWVKMRGPVYRDDNGEYLFFQGILNDVSNHKFMELALESQHEIFPWVADTMEDGLYIVSDDYRIQFMNKALIDMVGNHVGNLCYKALFDRDTVCPWSVMDAIKQESCGFQEYYLPKLEKTFQVRSFPIRRRDGSIGKVGQLRDITRTRELECQVQDYADRHMAIVDAANLSDLGIFILQDHEGFEARFRYANEAFCRITGFSGGELMDKSIAELVHPDSRHKVLDRYRRRQSGEPVRSAYELKMIRKDGAAIDGFISAAVSTYEGSIATIGFLRDFTERKKFQRSLWLSQRLASIGRLAAEIAHEINNPLTSVTTFNKLIERIIQQEPFPVHRIAELREYVLYLSSEASRCADIARNLLDFSRSGDIEIRQHDIRQILDKTLDVLKHRAQMGQIEIRTFHADNVPQLSCDFKRLQQAFVNIFWNAIEAMPEGGVLSVSTSFDPQQSVVELTIHDTGQGIPEEDIEQIFEPFFTTKEEGKGVGLGLSVSYGIIRQHHGKIEVRSETGKGTTFLVRFRADTNAPSSSGG